MNPLRLVTVFRLELRRQIRQPLIWILLLLLGLMIWGMSEGEVRIGTGDTSVGGKKAFITSEFANAQLQSVMVFMFYTFFIAVAAGMSVIRDEELKVGELIHTTPLKPGEYIWGKYLAVTSLFLGVLGVHLLLSITFNHLFTDPSALKYLGPFAAGNYLRPALIFSLPTVLFVSGTTFAIGTLTRKPILVFALPIAVLMGTGFFLWDWSPTWLDPSIDRVLMLLEPAGFRWLNEVWLKVDRGVDFYNTASVPLDGLILANRFGVALLGIASVGLAQRRFAASLKGARSVSSPRARRFGRLFRHPIRTPNSVGEVTSASAPRSLASMGMRHSAPGWFAATLDIARFELKGLLRQPGMYLFVPLILIQTIGGSLVSVGAFETPRLTTSGTYAAESVNTLTLLVCMLILFYTVESLLREQHTRLAPIFDATPVPTFSVLMGKSLANSAVGLLILLAAFLGGVVVMLIQGKVSLQISPFLLVWGLLLTPTFLVWASFVTMVLSLTRSRYTTYGIGLAVMIYTGYKQFRGEMNWVGNWDLWNAVNWSDMSFGERDGLALLLNRFAVIGLALLFTIITVRIHGRREFDPAGVLTRLRPLRFLRSSLGVIPFAVPPIVCLLALWFLVNAGSEGKAAEDRRKDYWRKNLATWKDAPVPSITNVALKVELEPERHWFHTRGSYRLANRYHDSIPQVPLTGGDHWEKVSWTLNGAPVTPEDRLRLYVFTPKQAMSRGDEIEIGFDVEGRLPAGITKNGGPAREFILPGGVVLTSFGPSFAPDLGFMEEIGVDDDNRYETKQYRDDFYFGETEPAYGAATPYTTRIEITGPAGYVYNSVGTQTSDSVADGKRTVVWQSDHPVNFFNIVAGRWDVREGKDTIIYYHPRHTYNIDEMQLMLDGARRWYSEWFYPFPWRTLKLSEFPNHATYAQGFPTNITFSEGIGFLTHSDQKARVASLVTAHESAHQWWGNILLPGKGPGGNILSEGMSHFSTIMLMGQIYGEGGRIETCRRLEERYGENRQVDSEKPLVKIDGSRAGDTTVTYDKGGWVFTMLQNLMGREANLKGLQSFISHYDGASDHPVLQDFIAHLRPFAPDAAAYDAFVQQWFYEVVVPEYRLSEARREKAADGDGWTVSVKVVNAGTGTMPVEIAALSGERFVEQTPGEAAREAAKESADYRHSGRIVTLGAGEEATVELSCDFEPDRIVVDPDARVLMLLRKNAVHTF